MTAFVEQPEQPRSSCIGNMANLSALSKVLLFKILATVIIWCIPLLCFPGAVLESIGLPPHPTYMFLRLLGWAYLALCVGYSFAFIESMKGRRLMSAIWAGIVSNGGACLLLLFHGAMGEWKGWGLGAQVILWGSTVATACITSGLYVWGVRGR